MAQKVLLNGSTYEISGGKVLIGNKLYNIVSGKALIGGVVQKISFRSKTPVKVYIYGDVGDSTDGVFVNGAEYLWGNGYVGDVYPGDQITGDVNWFVNGVYDWNMRSYAVPEGISQISITLSYDEDRGSEANIVVA